jgi:hypothetical protein
MAKNSTKRPDKILPKAVKGQTQKKPTPVPERDSMLWKKEMVDSGHGYKVAKWTRRASPKKAKPLDKSKKKGSPRSYENLKKAKPVGNGKKGKGPS